MSFLIQHFEADFQPKNPEFRNNPENFHPCTLDIRFWYISYWSLRISTVSPEPSMSTMQRMHNERKANAQAFRHLPCSDITLARNVPKSHELLNPHA